MTDRYAESHAPHPPTFTPAPAKPDYANEIEKQMDGASAAIGQHIGTLETENVLVLQRELAALKKAKEENDDRFMTERDQARNALQEAVIELHQARATISGLTLPIMPAPAPVLKHISAGGYRPHTNEEQVLLAIEALKHEGDLQKGQDLYEAINILVLSRDKSIEALTELVRLKDIKDALDAECDERAGTDAEQVSYNARKNEYAIQKQIAWNNARALLDYVAVHKEPTDAAPA